MLKTHTMMLTVRWNISHKYVQNTFNRDANIDKCIVVRQKVFTTSFYISPAITTEKMSSYSQNDYNLTLQMQIC